MPRKYIADTHMKHLLLAGSLILAGLDPLRAQSLNEIVPQDKQKHFAVGLCLGGIAYITAHDHYYYHGASKTQAHRKAMWWGAGVPMGAGLAKELYDGLIKRDPGWTMDDSVADFLTTSLAGISLVLIIDSATPERGKTP